MTRTRKCPTCRGSGTVLGMRMYPGTYAHRPQIECATCHGMGRIESTRRKQYRVRLELIFWAEGNRHADMLGREFVREALSSMQYSASIPLGESVSVVRDPAQIVEEN